MKTHHLLYVVPLCLTMGATAYAQNNLDGDFAAKKLRATISENAIAVQTIDHFDKYIISIAGADGYSKSFESDKPFFDISQLDLPFNGEFTYEVKAVRILGEEQEKGYLNNGRGENAKRLITEVESTSGSFNSQWGAIQQFEQIQEQPTAQSNEQW